MIYRRYVSDSEAVGGPERGSKNLVLYSLKNWVH